MIGDGENVTEDHTYALSEALCTLLCTDASWVVRTMEDFKESRPLSGWRGGVWAGRKEGRESCVIGSQGKEES